MICKHPLKRLVIDDLEASEKIGTHVNLIRDYRRFRNHEGWWRRQIIRQEDGNYIETGKWMLNGTLSI